MRVGEAFPSNWLKAADLDGEDKIVTITEVTEETINKEEKLVVHFKEEKSLVLNKTNAQAIAQVLGSDETDEWPGQRITLFSTTIDFNGKPTEAIRVKLRKPKGGSSAKAASDDDAPF